MLPSQAAKAFFGASLNGRRFEDWLLFLDGLLEKPSRGFFCASHNMHSLYLRHHDDIMARFYAQSEDCYIDGTPVRLLARLFGYPGSRSHRFTLMDELPQLLDYAQQRGWRVFYLGSSREVVIQAGRWIAEYYPDLDIALHDGFFTDDNAVVSAINEQAPHLLLVGMGMPKQERWLLEYRTAITFGCAVQTGATVDYFVGAQAKPPVWMSRWGLAWLYRLAHDPVRLSHRYLIEPWGLVVPAVRALRDHRRERRAVV